MTNTFPALKPHVPFPAWRSFWNYVPRWKPHRITFFSVMSVKQISRKMMRSCWKNFKIFLLTTNVFALHSWTCSLIAFRSIREIPNGLDSAFPFRPCFYYTQEARQTLVRSKTVYRFSPKKSAAKWSRSGFFRFFLCIYAKFPIFSCKSAGNYGIIIISTDS